MTRRQRIRDVAIHGGLFSAGMQTREIMIASGFTEGMCAGVIFIAILALIDSIFFEDWVRNEKK